ncbi:DUF2129 domain-containing protein [Acholeplasma sp. OttesenSCG-928-E16]|nr:DUF2129 domain-containing protein [Acholeplasma sp. OttesenSCG-928-E16]
MVKRSGLIVHYQGKKVLDKLNELDVHVVYTSKKQHYSVFYIDAGNESKIKKILNNTKGFRHLSPSLLSIDEYDFDENQKSEEIEAN